MVRRVFFSNGTQSVRQVVFSAVEPHVDVATICDQAAIALAMETRSPIAIVSRERRIAELGRVRPDPAGSAIRSWSTQMSGNLWRVPEDGLRRRGDAGTGMHWVRRLEELRNEFEYVVIHGPPAGTSSEATLLGQIADGIILVVGAHTTRREVARRIKERLEASQSRILGTVLSDRTFPMPEMIYRRL
jgi:hypothetical protein